MTAVDLWVMLGFTAALFPLVFRTGRLTRVAGACLIATYGWPGDAEEGANDVEDPPRGPSAPTPRAPLARQQVPAQDRGRRREAGGQGPRHAAGDHVLAGEPEP